MKRTVFVILYMMAAVVLSGCLSTKVKPVETRADDLGGSSQRIKKPTLGVQDNLDKTDQEDSLQDRSFSVKNREAVEPFTPDDLLDLTLEKAVFSALERNRSLQVEQFKPIIAGTFVDIEQAVFDPVFFAQARFENYKDRSLEDIASRFFSIYGNRSLISTGVAKQFPTGTDVSLDLALKGSDNDASSYSDEMRLGLNLTQALLRDAGSAVNLAGIRQAESGALASVYSLRGFTEALVAAVENAYWNYALAVRQVEIFQESFQLAQRQLEVVRTRIDVGQIAETEETVINAELALREQQLINANNQRERARLTLLRLLNPLSSEGWDRQVLLNQDAVVPEVSLGSALEHEALALKLRPDLNEARLRARSGALETIRTANGLLPRLDFFIVLGKTGYSQSFGASVNDLSGPGYDFTIGLDYELPIYNRANRALDRRARASYQKDLQAIENLKQLISLDIRNALLEVRRSLQQITVSNSRRILQEEVVRAETVRFGVGTTTALDVARVQRDLLESRISEVDAIVNYRQALTDLYHLDGTLLMRRGIQGPGAEEVVLGITEPDRQ